MNSKDIHNAISSPESPDGPTPLNLPDGFQHDLFGLEVALASLSATQDSAKEPTTNAIYGPSGIALSENASPLSLWATPVAHEARLGYQHRHDQAKGTQKSLTTEAVDSLGLGANVSGLSEPTEKRGGLNPEFVCWLMGFPQEWLNFAPLEMPSSRKSRRKL